ncbi:tRNA (adenosine(37)-N6)-dimethylallyltransferase MiaA [Gracilinema caldarium]|uniref:tRNA (adenosine(37)-N6)-dimethylallyltransferase MiaA n=1 Tax=Gracilinema caldarium TaxID=215591 RepID=UPI0026EC3031|nr:tRNA (adenosine(37)-N6)-dimethylallyltransferase MiaA [Gracilinema caldarium]
MIPDRTKDTPLIPVVLLFGPTASGKTDILEHLFTGSHAIAEAEIVSADSMQVYRGMDIGTAKPGAELRSRLPHHLIDICDIKEQFTVGDFVRHADQACLDIYSWGKLPVVSGGTGFYLKNFVLGLPEAPPSDADIRSALKAELENNGAAALVEELQRVDPVSAGRIHPNDTYRLLRALEVYRLTGKPLSSFSVSGSSGHPTGGDRPRYRFLLIGIQRNRENLYQRINQRTHEMFLRGLSDEVAGLVAQGYTRTDPGMRAIGYQEFFLEDGTLCSNLALVEELVAQNSRRYAKRQITFFSALQDVHWIGADNADTSDELPAHIETLVKEFILQ